MLIIIQLRHWGPLHRPNVSPLGAMLGRLTSWRCIIIIIIIKCSVRTSSGRCDTVDETTVDNHQAGNSRRTVRWTFHHRVCVNASWRQYFYSKPILPQSAHAVSLQGRREAAAWQNTTNDKLLIRKQTISK